MKVTNPILSGFYPDPSICRVGADYYLVNSSFAYFPGVPIWHSQNLADWKQIGNVLDRESQIPLKGCRHSQGIYAPTIRYYNGTYYMITTNVSGGGNFIVTSKQPEGPWSEPYYLGEEAPGIDPSLFFDFDGSCYYIGTRPNPEGVRYNGDWEIWIQKLDLATMKLVGESQAVWKGALKDVIWPEGPHLYHIGEYYYLMIAEGGTGPNHAVTIARSKELWGPYENNPNNPILTHRHLGNDYPVVYIGHGDLVDDTEGNWYIVMLGSRKWDGHAGLGRETFLAKVRWEEDWPIVNPGIGKLEDVVELPYEGKDALPQTEQSLANFSDQQTDVIMLRNADRNFYEVTESGLQMKFLPVSLKDLGSPAYLGFRQLSYHYEASLKINPVGISDQEETGLVILQSNEYHVLLRVTGTDKVGLNKVEVVKCLKGIDHILASVELNQISTYDMHEITLQIRVTGFTGEFIVLYNHQETSILKDVDIHEMSTEVAGGFVGNTIGVYAFTRQETSDNKVHILDLNIRY